MQFPILIELRRSFFLSCLLGLIHLQAFLCIAVLPWPLLVRLLLLLPVGLSLFQALQPPNIFALKLHKRTTTLECRRRGHEWGSCSVLPSSVVFSKLIVLRMRQGESNRVISLALFSDQMDAGSFRALKIWLRWSASGGALS